MHEKATDNARGEGMHGVAAELGRTKYQSGCCICIYRRIVEHGFG